MLRATGASPHALTAAVLADGAALEAPVLGAAALAAVLALGAAVEPQAPTMNTNAVVMASGLSHPRFRFMVLLLPRCQSSRDAGRPLWTALPPCSLKDRDAAIGVPDTPFRPLHEC